MRKQEGLAASTRLREHVERHHLVLDAERVLEVVVADQMRQPGDKRRLARRGMRQQRAACCVQSYHRGASLRCGFGPASWIPSFCFRQVQTQRPPIVVAATPTKATRRFHPMIPAGHGPTKSAVDPAHFGAMGGLRG